MHWCLCLSIVRLLYTCTVHTCMYCIWSNVDSKTLNRQKLNATTQRRAENSILLWIYTFMSETNTIVRENSKYQPKMWKWNLKWWPTSLEKLYRLNWLTFGNRFFWWYLPVWSTACPTVEFLGEDSIFSTQYVLVHCVLFNLQYSKRI